MRVWSGSRCDAACFSLTFLTVWGSLAWCIILPCILEYTASAASRPVWPVHGSYTGWCDRCVVYTDPGSAVKLTQSVIIIYDVCLFKARLDKFWMHEDVIYDFTADLTGIGDISVRESSWLKYDHIDVDTDWGCIYKVAQSVNRPFINY